MRILTLIALIFTFPALAQRVPASDLPFNDWKSYLEHEKGILADLFPDGKYLDGKWVKFHEFNVDGSQLPPGAIDVLPLTCEDKNLYPTHPQQYTKEYIYGVVSKYDNRRLPGKSSSCEIATQNAKAHCIVAMKAVVAVISDTYEDGCGKLYRGYWLKDYRIANDKRKTEDNMGTLFSLGRTQYDKLNAQFPGEVVDGSTYPVKVDEFLFLATLRPGDVKRIREAQGYAVKAGFKKVGKIWKAK